MTPEEVKAVRNQIGSSKAMAELLGITTRALRYHLRNGVKRKKTEREIRQLVEPPQ